MGVTSRRPKIVWAIFLIYGLGGVRPLYAIYLLLTASTNSSQRFEMSLSYIFEVFCFLILPIIAATLMFFRVAFNRWLYAFVLVMSVIYLGFQGFSSFDIPQINSFFMAARILSIIISTLITWYSFRLLNSGYYNLTKIKSS